MSSLGSSYDPGGLVPTLDVQIEPVGDGVARLVLEGTVDMTTAQALSARFAEALEQRPRRVEVDCAAVTFMDSTGLNVLAQVWSQVRDGSGDHFGVTRAAPQVRRVLEICGLARLLVD